MPLFRRALCQSGDVGNGEDVCGRRAAARSAGRALVQQTWHTPRVRPSLGINATTKGRRAQLFSRPPPPAQKPPYLFAWCSPPDTPPVICRSQTRRYSRRLGGGWSRAESGIGAYGSTCPPPYLRLSHVNIAGSRIMAVLAKKLNETGWIDDTHDKSKGAPRGLEILSTALIA